MRIFSNKNILSLLFVLLFLHGLPAFGRDMYYLMEETPLAMVIEDDYLLYTPARYFDYTRQACNKLLIKFDFKTKAIDTISDEELPSEIYSLTNNKSQIFVGGKGLAVYDKNSKNFKRWKEFDNYLILKIIADDQRIWLGTERKGLIEVDLNTREKRFYQKSDGLNSNNVISLMQIKNLLFVGTYRYGSKWSERKEEIYGLGLNKINLKTLKISEIALPKNRYQPDLNKLVFDMYPVLIDSNYIKLVLWYPWQANCWEYDYVNDKFRKSEDNNHHLQSILNTYKIHDNSKLAEILIDFVLNRYNLINYRAEYDAIKMIYKNGDLKRITERLKDSNSNVRMATIWGLFYINDSIAKSFLVNRLEIEPDSNVKYLLRQVLEWMNKH